MTLELAEEFNVMRHNPSIAIATAAVVDTASMVNVRAFDNGLRIVETALTFAVLELSLAICGWGLVSAGMVVRHISKKSIRTYPIAGIGA